MRKIKLRKRVKCPTRTIVVIDSNAEDDTDYAWVFGPHTRNPWPEGDYYSDGEYYEPASGDYDSFYNDGDEYYVEYQVHPPHMLVDIGL